MQFNLFFFIDQIPTIIPMAFSFNNQLFSYDSGQPMKTQRFHLVCRGLRGMLPVSILARLTLGTAPNGHITPQNTRVA